MVEEYLLSYTGTLIFVSHDRPLLNRLANGILELKHGRLLIIPEISTNISKLGNCERGIGSAERPVATTAKTFAIVYRSFRRESF